MLQSVLKLCRNRLDSAHISEFVTFRLCVRDCCVTAKGFSVEERLKFPVEFTEDISVFVD